MKPTTFFWHRDPAIATQKEKEKSIVIPIPEFIIIIIILTSVDQLILLYVVVLYDLRKHRTTSNSNGSSAIVGSRCPSILVDAYCLWIKSFFRISERRWRAAKSSNKQLMSTQSTIVYDDDWDNNSLNNDESIKHAKKLQQTSSLFIFWTWHKIVCMNDTISQPTDDDDDDFVWERKM
jgi:hypothetical protein